MQPAASHTFDNFHAPIFYDAEAAAAAWRITTAFLARYFPTRAAEVLSSVSRHKEVSSTGKGGDDLRWNPHRPTGRGVQPYPLGAHINHLTVVTEQANYRVPHRACATHLLHFSGQLELVAVARRAEIGDFVSPSDPDAAARERPVASESDRFRVLRRQVLRVRDIHRVVDMRVGVQLVTPHPPADGERAQRHSFRS